MREPLKCSRLIQKQECRCSTYTIKGKKVKMDLKLLRLQSPNYGGTCCPLNACSYARSVWSCSVPQAYPSWVLLEGSQVDERSSRKSLFLLKTFKRTLGQAVEQSLLQVLGLGSKQGCQTGNPPAVAEPQVSSCL